MLHFLFTTWVGGIVCATIALLIAGVPIVNFLNKEKKILAEKARKIQEELKKHNSNNPTMKS